jgi:hypothetical protein
VTAGGYQNPGSASVICPVQAVTTCTPLFGFLGPVSSLVYRADGLLTALVPIQDAMVAFPDTFTAQADIATGGLPGGPTRSALGPDGEMWFTQTGAGTILNGGTGQPVALPRPGTQPWDITAGPDGALWFTESQGGAIGRVTTSGQVTEFPLPAGSGRPFGITTGPDGNIWFTTRSPAAVVRMSFDPVTPAGRGGGGGGGGAGVVADRAAPRVSPGLRLAGFRQGRGSTFTFSLSEPAKVSIKVERRLGTGRRVDGRCVRRTRRNRSRPVCTRYSSVGTVRTDGRQGVNELRFSGRLNGRALSPGTYRASLTATDAAGNASAVSRATFTVRRR